MGKGTKGSHGECRCNWNLTQELCLRRPILSIRLSPLPLPVLVPTLRDFININLELRSLISLGKPTPCSWCCILSPPTSSSPVFPTLECPHNPPCLPQVFLYCLLLLSSSNCLPRSPLPFILPRYSPIQPPPLFPSGTSELQSKQNQASPSLSFSRKSFSSLPPQSNPYIPSQFYPKPFRILVVIGWLMWSRTHSSLLWPSVRNIFLLSPTSRTGCFIWSPPHTTTKL